jgi:surface polysaccharide O-acyltransferase-like enzyme
MSGKKNWIAVANVCACLGVIILHCNGVFWTFPSGRLWYTSNFLETFFYWPVPVFFMISGATLMNYRDRYSTMTFFKKRIQRTVIPFLAWSIISVLYRYFYCHWPHDGLRDTISGVLTTKYIGIYWFFIPLFAVYMSFPLLSAVEKKYRQSVFLLIAGLTFLFTSLLPTVFTLTGLRYNEGLQIPVAGGYMIYVLIGYLISNSDLKKKTRYLFYAIGLLGWFIQFVGTNLLSLPAGKIVETFKGYVNFPAVMQAVGIFVFFRYACDRWKRLERFDKICMSLSKYTFGIYLVHFYLVEIIPGLMHIDTGSICWRTVGAVAVFAISALICFVISKIPAVRKCIGL